MDMTTMNGRYIIRMSLLKVAALVVIIFGEVTGFDPSLKVDSCTRESVTVTLTEGVNGGIIYVQGRGAGCKQTTCSKPAKHKFDFNDCRMKWGETFRLVVQRKAEYQTGEDKQFPVTCFADLDGIDVNNKMDIIANHYEDEQLMLIKPSASMRLLTNGRDVGGTPVSLGDIITLELRLDAEYESDFDISVKSCIASGIPIIKNSCAVDAELFPKFTRVSRGFLSSTFGAFRKTDFIGGVVTMTFSCTLEVCLGSCTLTLCPGGHGGLGKKKRQLSSHAKRHYDKNEEMIPVSTERGLTTGTDQQVVTDPTYQENDTYAAIQSDALERENNITVSVKRKHLNDTEVEDIFVQNIIAISPDEGVQAGTEQKTEVCLNYGFSITLIVCMAVSFVGFGVTAWILIKRSSQTRKQLDDPRRRHSGYNKCNHEYF